jgi:hypothetical protein
LLAKPIAMGRRSVTLAILTVFSFPYAAQDIKSLQDTFIEAEYFFVQDDYQDALPYYLQIFEKLPDNANIAYRIGVCYMNTEGKKNLSIEYLEKASRNIAAKHREGTITQVSASYDVLFDLAKAYLVNYRFDDAKETFLKYAGTLLPDDVENRNFIDQQVKACDTAKEMIANPVSLTEENLGVPFNDEKRNFNPVISADGKSFAFMVSMKFYDAIFLTRLVDGKWTSPVNMTPELQSDGDMFISCLSTDGKTLFLSKDDNFNSDLYTSTFDGTRWHPNIRLNKNINTKYWESHGFNSDDGNKLIFASDRPGGYGGLDLYLSVKVNGDWGPAINLGPEINTPFNEDRPFLVNNGKSLFFSSQGHVNMGGYDLFRSELQQDGRWTQPVNLGFPLNTPDDNIFFMPVGNGKSGYCSIYKEKEGYGNEDIYKVTFR